MLSLKHSGSFAFKINFEQSLAMLLRVAESPWLTLPCILSAGTAGEAKPRAGVSRGHTVLSLFQGLAQLLPDPFPPPFLK